ncbi:MAG: hypothetical protein J6J81_06885 [Oscillospiraceae bacterium]|nr:hypothetical protein [Oscillospiraceae bacterium]
MGWLVGLPLGIFHIVFTLLMLAVRLAVPLALVALTVVLVRRSRGGTSGTRNDPPKEPEFRGPVYTVDYEEVDEEAEKNEDENG